MDVCTLPASTGEATLAHAPAQVQASTSKQQQPTPAEVLREVAFVLHATRKVRAAMRPARKRLSV